MSGSIRIVAGRYGGRRIEVPARGTRPLADRVRQSLFAILEPRLEGARVLDLCAGSGAAGLESLSRGATFAHFVEMSREAVDVLRRNIAALGCAASCSVRHGDAVAAARGVAPSSGGDGGQFDLVIFDPPYDDAELRSATLAALAAPSSALAADGLLVVSGRRSRGEGAAAPPFGLRLVRQLDFGETEITLLERSHEIAPDADLQARG